MTVNSVDIFRLTNEELWRGLKELAARERVLAADAVAYVAETQRRRLHEDHGWRSMFEYCVQSLRWSEATAFRRTRAAKAVIAYPVILEMLYDGRLHVEGVVILHAFLDDEDFPSLLLKAVGKTAKEIEWLVAERRVEPVRRDSIRVVGVQPVAQAASAVPAAPAVPGAPAAPDAREEEQALPLMPSSEPEAQAPGRREHKMPDRPPAKPDRPPPVAAPRLVRFAFTADETLYCMVLRAQQLLRHKYPNGSLEGVFKDVLKLLIEKKDLGLRAEAAARRRARRKE